MRYLLLLLLLSPALTQAQDGGYSIFRTFTVADGLPSNHIYNCVEDNKGFLWIATDAGVARFDGKYFQTFTTREGLPDNEVLNVVKENNGRIWVCCFKQSPSYFDEVRNRFINAKDDSDLARVSGTRAINLVALKEGGVMYWNENGSYIFREKKLIYTANELPVMTVKTYPDGSYIGYCGVLSSPLCYVEHGRPLDSLPINRPVDFSHGVYSFVDGKFFFPGMNPRMRYVLSSIERRPLRCNLDSVAIDEAILFIRSSHSLITITGDQGRLYAFGKKDLKRRFVLSGNYVPNTLYDDTKGNVWVGTVDKGLLLYKRKTIETFISPDNFPNTHYLSIARQPGGRIIAGNFYGQIVETDGKYFSVHNLPNYPSGWQRDIIPLRQKIFSFSEHWPFIDYVRPLRDANSVSVPVKCAVAINDSIIVTGELSGLGLVHAVSEKRSLLPALVKRTTCIEAAPGNIVYHGSTDGLYQFDLNLNRDTSLVSRHSLLSDRIVAICASDAYVWVATANNGIVILRNDSVVRVIAAGEGIISNDIRCMKPGRAGDVWIGTGSGLTIARYRNGLHQLSYQNLTANDGLSSNIINDMVYSNDTMYCATGSGICAIPGGISVPPFDIPVFLTGVSINGRDTAVIQAYQLRHDANNISLEFAGVEPGGHFGYFQYRIDAEDWRRLEGRSLTLQLSSGTHVISVRAIDVNGNVGTKTLLVRFEIATPFWKTIWFWCLLSLLMTGLFAWYIRRRETRRREAALQVTLSQKKLVELELQALKSQINPHFIFNCLNSIKLLQHQQRYAETERYLDQFAQLLRAALVHSSLQQISLKQEISFIENYLSLEQLRFQSKLEYRIEPEHHVDLNTVLIPTMLLQPYVENAVKHGVSPLKTAKGCIIIRFRIEGAVLVAEVEDNGVGLDEAATETAGTGIGNDNTKRRSRLYKIESSIVDLRQREAGLSGTLVQLRIPLQHTPHTHHTQHTHDSSSIGR